MTFNDLYGEHVATMKERIGAIEVAYCSWEGTPCLVVTDHESRGVTCYEFVGGAWREPLDNGATVFTKAGMLRRDQFERMFPNVGLPKQITDR